MEVLMGRMTMNLRGVMSKRRKRELESKRRKKEVGRRVIGVQEECVRINVKNWKELSSRTYNNYQMTIQNSHLNSHPDAQCNYHLGQGRGSRCSRERTLE